jgi:hypothetical protein
MAAMNKSLARNNKSQDRVQKPAGDYGGALPLLPLNASPAPNADAPPAWPDLPIRGRPGCEPNGGDKQVFGVKQQVLDRAKARD